MPGSAGGNTNVSSNSYYVWRSKYGGVQVSDVKRLKALESENARLKKVLAKSMLETATAPDETEYL